MGSEARTRLFLLFLVSLSFAALSDAVGIKLTNMLESGTDLPISCYNGDRPTKDYGSKTLPSEQTWDFNVYTGFLGARLVVCDFKSDGEAKFFTVYSKYRDWRNYKARCWWHLKKDKICMMNWFSGEYDKCFTYMSGSWRDSFSHSPNSV